MPSQGLTRERAAAVRGLMPELKADLARLVAIPSVSALRCPADTKSNLVIHGANRAWEGK